MNQIWIEKVVAELNQTNKSSETNKEGTSSTTKMGRVLKKNWEGRDKIIKKILDTTIFCYTNNYFHYKMLDVLTPMGHQTWINQKERQSNILNCHSYEELIHWLFHEKHDQVHIKICKFVVV
jgi:hypothetical protein